MTADERRELNLAVAKALGIDPDAVQSFGPPDYAGRGAVTWAALEWLHARHEIVSLMTSPISTRPGVGTNGPWMDAIYGATLAEAVCRAVVVAAGERKVPA